MAVKFTKPEINVREKLAELDKPSGIAGEAMLRAETPQEQQALIGVGRRNLIINGGMVFSQRNGTSAITLNTQGSIIFDFDRWSRQIYQAGKLTLQQVTDAPSGFSYSIKATTVSAITGGGADYYQFNQPIEGFNTAHLAYGTSSARTTTLSFWVKSTLTGQWSGAIKNSAGNRAYTFPYYINSPSTWEYKTVTIPGDTSGTWIGSTNGTGVRLLYDLGTSRTDLHGTLNSWTATNSYASSTGVKLVQNASATWQITGVQLEVGKVATPFEQRSYGEELALCQRYYQRHGGGTYCGIAMTQVYNNTSQMFSFLFPVKMRAAPSFGFSNLIVTDRLVYDSDVTALTPQGTSDNGVQIKTTNASNAGSARQAAQLAVKNGTTGYIEFKAEL